MTAGWERKLRRTITFTTKDGRYAGKIEVRETGARGNRHFNQRRPDGPLCTEPGCGEPWRPICPNYRCPGSKVPRGMIRSEKQDAGTKRYPGHPALERKPEPKPHRARRESPTRIIPSHRHDASVMDGKLKALEAKYGGRHGRRRAA